MEKVQPNELSNHREIKSKVFHQNETIKYGRRPVSHDGIFNFAIRFIESRLYLPIL